jgi:hypothetical protein
MMMLLGGLFSSGTRGMVGWFLPEIVLMGRSWLRSRSIENGCGITGSLRADIQIHSLSTLTKGYAPEQLLSRQSKQTHPYIRFVVVIPFDPKLF